MWFLLCLVWSCVLSTFIKRILYCIVLYCKMYSCYWSSLTTADLRTLYHGDPAVRTVSHVLKNRNSVIENTANNLPLPLRASNVCPLLASVHVFDGFVKFTTFLSSLRQGVPDHLQRFLTVIRHLITVTTFTRITYHCLYISLQT